MIRRRKPLARSSKPIDRKPVKRGRGRRGTAIKKKTDAALDFYFRFSDIQPCQICGFNFHRRQADPCHLWKRHHNLHDPEHMLAGHRECHQFLDNGAHMDRITTARASGVNCASEGVIKWSPAQRLSLDTWLRDGTDPHREKQIDQDSLKSYKDAQEETHAEENRSEAGDDSQGG